MTMPMIVSQEKRENFPCRKRTQRDEGRAGKNDDGRTSVAVKIDYERTDVPVIMMTTRTCNNERRKGDKRSVFRVSFFRGK